MALLTQGKRDREIAQQLIISESTVKFHMNNVLVILKAKTRCQAITQAIALKQALISDHRVQISFAI